MSDHYAVLGLQQTATNEEITTAFRRLALMHHPDKNPGDISGATKRFQQIQLAYGVLSDDSNRRRYNASRNNTSPTEDVRYGGERTYHSLRNTGFDGPFFDARFRWASDGLSPQYSLAEALRICQVLLGRHWEERETSGEARKDARKEAREEAREWMEKKRKRREMEQNLREAAKQAERASTEARWKALFDQETQRQQARWESTGAVTEEERFSTCLHSEFCAKIQLRKKVKCDACGAKRGPIAFECPHCVRHLCQLCVTTFTKKRAKAS